MFVRKSLVVLVAIVMIAVLAGLIPVARPAIARYYFYRANSLQDEGKQEGAIDSYSHAISVDPNFTQAYVNRANLRLKKGGLAKDAIADYTEAIQRDPNLAIAYFKRGLSFEKMDQFDKAIADYAEVKRLTTSTPARLPKIYVHRGDQWAKKSDGSQKAIDDYGQAIHLRPKYAAAWFRRAMLWARLGAYDKAIADLTEVLRLTPRDMVAWNRRAWIGATCPDEKYRNGKKAVADAKQACKLSRWRTGINMDTLAAAYAEAADFPNAVSSEEIAIKLSPDGQKPALQSRLALFKAHKPFREESSKK